MKQILQELHGILGPGDWRIIGGLPRDYQEHLLRYGKEPNWEPSPVHDVDIVWDADDATLKALGASKFETSQAAPVQNLKTARLGIIQIAAPRIEVKEKQGTNGFSYQRADYFKDAERRDAAMNAIAMDADGNIYDFFNGAEAIKARTFRHITEAGFIEDPVRWLRACRFTTKGYSIHPDTMALMRSQIFQDEVASTVPERILLETLKAMKGAKPSNFFRAIVEIGIGRQFFSEIFEMTEVPAGPAEYHPEGSLFEHSCITLDKAAETIKDPEVLLGVFLHDLGKLYTDKNKRPKYIDHDIVGIEAIRTFLSRFNPAESTVKTAQAICRLHMTAALWNVMKLGSKISLADKAIQAGIAEHLPSIVAADTSMKPEETVVMENFDLACKAVKTSLNELIGPRIKDLAAAIKAAGKQAALTRRTKAPQLEIEKAQAHYTKTLDDFNSLVTGERARRFRLLLQQSR